MIDLLSRHYNGNIVLNPALDKVNLEAAKRRLPPKLCDILEKSNGIKEAGTESGAWIVYPYDMIVEETEFYNDNYFLGGTIFAANGAGEPYYMDSEGYVYKFEVVDNVEVVVANSIEEFFG